MQHDGLAEGGSIFRHHGSIDDRPGKGYVNLCPENGPAVYDGDGF
jgi:hypothetical protein